MVSASFHRGACSPPRRHAYLVFNKPKGVVCTMHDPEGRPTITDYLGRHSRERLYHVGRLDTDTEGMLLLTNDGDFAARMMHPRYELPKTYVAEVTGLVQESTVSRLRKGVRLEDGPIKPDQVRLGTRTPSRTMVSAWAAVLRQDGDNTPLRASAVLVLGVDIVGAFNSYLRPAFPCGRKRVVNDSELGFRDF